MGRRRVAGRCEKQNGVRKSEWGGVPLKLSPIAVAVMAALSLASGEGQANPQGGVVQAGQARIQQTAPNRLDIIQGSQRAAINWQRFSIGREGHVNFQQPSSTAATLNRVVGSDPSTILGRLTANGQVFLINPNGVLFGQGAKIDVGSLVTSTANISNENFMAGLLKFDQVTNRAATIVNRGEITAAKGGLVALVAPGVENAGVIRAELGRVVLASGNAFTLDLYGDKLVRLVVDDQALDRLTDIEGRPLRSLVANSGRIEADGGQVLLATSAAKAVLDSAVNMSGVILARTVEQRPGEIVLAAGAGTTSISGTLDSSGKGAGERGGSVQVLGENIALAATSHIDASGAAGGGAVLVGGDWQGDGATTPRAANTIVEPGSRINADALSSGDGGKVVVWSDGATQFGGAISARGGTQGGNGGKVEVSGKGTLNFTGLVDAAGPRGNPGTLLLDPTDWIIGTAEADSFSRPLREGTNVIIQADRDIEVNESIDGRGGLAGAALALTAGNQIRVNNDLLTNNGAIGLTAGLGGIQMGLGSRATNGQGAVISAGNQPITVNSVGAVSAQHLFTSGAVQITTTGANANVVLNRDLNGLANAPIGSLAITAAGAIQAMGLTATGGATLAAGQGLEFAPSADNSFAASAINASAAGDMNLGGDLVTRSGGAIDLRSTGGRITMGAGGLNGVSTLSAEGAGNVSLTSAQRLTVGHVLTSGSVRLESTADTVALSVPLLGAVNTNGIGPLTLRTGGDLQLNQPLKSTGGIDIQAGNGAGGTFRDLRVTVGTTNRIEANAGAGTASPIVLTGREVTLETGEVHSNGGDITINPQLVVPNLTAGRVSMTADSGSLPAPETSRSARRAGPISRDSRSPATSR